MKFSGLKFSISFSRHSKWKQGILKSFWNILTKLENHDNEFFLSFKLEWLGNGDP